MAILFGHHFDEDLLSEVLEINQLISNEDSNSQPTAKLKIAGLRKKVYDKITNIYNVPISSLKNVNLFGYDWHTADSSLVTPEEDIKRYYSFYVHQLKAHYDSIKAKSITTQNDTNLNNTNLSKIITLATAVNLSSFKEAVVYSLAKPDLQGITVLADPTKLSYSELSVLASIISRQEIKLVLTGETAIDKERKFKKVPLFDFDTRLKNLTTSLQSIEKLRQYIENIQLLSNNLPSTSTKFISNIQASLNLLEKDISANRKLLDEKYILIKRSINNEYNLTYTTWAQATNEFTDIKTRGSYKIIPDIGLAGILGIGNEGNKFVPRPYLGASIYFRPVDKNIAFKHLSHQALHRFSLNIGITTGKIENDEFSDLYNNLTVLLGGNCKITQELSFAFGTALLQRINANPAIEDKKITANPYIGLALDIDFANAIQKLTGKLF